MATGGPEVEIVFRKAAEPLLESVRKTREAVEALRIWIEAGGLDIEKPERKN